jgi:CRP-like cAMP-binding protein
MKGNDDRATSLQGRGLFGGLEPGDVEGIVGAGTPVSFSAGQAIFESGDEGDAMYVILRGEAQVDVGGRFHTLKTGDFFGEMALLAPGKRRLPSERRPTSRRCGSRSKDSRRFFSSVPMSRSR